MPSTAMDSIASLSPIPSTTRRDFLEEALRAAILSGQLEPGSQMVEGRLAEQFRVSRGPLREAIRTLADEGLLVVRPYTGTYVAKVTEEDLVEVHTVRLALETQAFKLCWPHRDESFRNAFKGRLKTLIEVSETGPMFEEIKAELAFHSVPFEFSGNRLLQEFWRQLAQKIQMGFSVYRRASNGCHVQREFHERYMDAAFGDDVDLCVKEVERHITGGIISMRSYFRSVKNIASTPQV